MKMPTKNIISFGKVFSSHVYQEVNKVVDAFSNIVFESEVIITWKAESKFNAYLSVVLNYDNFDLLNKH